MHAQFNTNLLHNAFVEPAVYQLLSLQIFELQEQM